jgi:N-acetylglucosamine-6-phosphate deacetylase
MRIHARHYGTGRPVEVLCEGERIRSISDGAGSQPSLSAQWVAPALFDLQVNGSGGHNFSSERLTVDMVRQVVDDCRRHGIAGICPTLVTNSFAALAHGMSTIRQACETDADIAASVPAIHLEGPYISAEDGPRGAHPRQHVRPPDWDEFRRLQDAAGGRIRLLTLAPEHAGAMVFIRRLVESGVVVAIGHTAASGQQIREAAAAGARLSTHLGNGSHALLPRHDNYIWEQLAEDGLWASVIADGHHLPPAVLKVIMRVKTPARTVLTCDASMLAGLPAGRYREFETDIDILPSKKIVVASSGYLAGSWALTDLCVGNAIRYVGVTLHEAVDMAGARPRELLGLPPRRLAAGDPADLVLFDWEPGGDFRVVATVVGGRTIPGAAAS